MSPDTLKLYHSPALPNSRRVRIFLAEKGAKIPLVAVDLGKGEQHSEAYRAVNPRRVFRSKDGKLDKPTNALCWGLKPAAFTKLLEDT